jgi:hypothetical protein
MSQMEQCKYDGYKVQYTGATVMMAWAYMHMPKSPFTFHAGHIGVPAEKIHDIQQEPVVQKPVSLILG